MSIEAAPLIDVLRDELGPGGVLVGTDVGPRYHVDWTQKFACPPIAVARPRSTAEVAAVLKHCHAHGQSVVVQGGMTGLAGGATPRAGELALSLERLSGIEAVDADAGTMLVGAGTPLAVAQEAAARYGLALPLDLPARGSATIGGTIATNAGGNRVIRYGMMRSLVLGLETVMADGTVLSSLNPMLKNNAGYDLKHLFVGSEGTLGVVTRAMLRLFPEPKERLTALVALDSFDAVVALLRAARSALGGALGAFEAMWGDYYDAACDYAKAGARPFAARHGYYVLVEVEALDPAADRDRLEALLADAIERGVAADAVLAGSLDEATRLWRPREVAGEMLHHYAPVAVYDVSVPLARMARYVEEITAKSAAAVPGKACFVFGHLGDGNLHVAVPLRGPADLAPVDAAVYGSLEGFGSVSAEHGIGTLKRQWLGHSRTPAEIELMRALKRQLDPLGILNPGRVI